MPPTPPPNPVNPVPPCVARIGGACSVSAVGPTLVFTKQLLHDPAVRSAPVPPRASESCPVHVNVCVLTELLKLMLVLPAAKVCVAADSPPKLLMPEPEPVQILENASCPAPSVTRQSPLLPSAIGNANVALPAASAAFRATAPLVTPASASRPLAVAASPIVTFCVAGSTTNPALLVSPVAPLQYVRRLTVPLPVIVPEPTTFHVFAGS